MLHIQSLTCKLFTLYIYKKAVLFAFVWKFISACICELARVLHKAYVNCFFFHCKQNPPTHPPQTPFNGNDMFTATRIVPTSNRQIPATPTLALNYDCGILTPTRVCFYFFIQLLSIRLCL